MSQSAAYGHDLPSVADLMNQSREEIKRRLTIILSQNEGSLETFDLRVLNKVITVDLRFSTKRNTNENLRFIFFPAVLLSVDPVSFLGRENSTLRFSYSPSCDFMLLIGEVEGEIRKQTAGSRKEDRAVVWFEELAKNNKSIKSISLSDGADDRKGIDLFVKIHLPSHKPVNVPIQIKSRALDQWKHRLDPRKRHIPSMVIDNITTFEEIKEKMMNLLLQYVEKKKVMHISRHGSWLGVFAP